MEQHREWIRSDNKAQRTHQDSNPGLYRKNLKSKGLSTGGDNPDQQNAPYQSTYVEAENYSFTGTPQISELTKSFDGFNPNAQKYEQRSYSYVKPATQTYNYTRATKSADYTPQNAPVQENNYKVELPYGNVSQRTVNHLTMLKNSNPDMQIKVQSAEYYEPTEKTQAQQREIQPNEERMTFANYSRLSTRPIRGEYKPVAQKPKAQKIEFNNNNKQSTRSFSTGGIKPKEQEQEQGISQSILEYTDQVVKYNTNQRSFPNTIYVEQGSGTPTSTSGQAGNKSRNVITQVVIEEPNSVRYGTRRNRSDQSRNISSEQQSRDYSSSSSDGLIKIHIPYKLREYDGQKGVMDFGVKIGRRFVHGDPNLYLFHK
ncbi:MAG: hypothetical protein EZS28_018537 [Streblomastix strix]|uniref:Uncharacterized protein n=2 Tax=Streblomastix strix TaxID=222440 RepID=A0A5J4VUU2_9EUKA|nr:MAG: hypothetical protein EZS28_018537 [Streblomastix strix]